jgi:Na+-transporting methylmalonyl-CoA/oxaloacetate decarboxylase beta subunit
MGTLFVDPAAGRPDRQLMNIMQIDWLQPVYTLTFSNGLIACLVFMGIGVLLDVGYVMARPFQSMIIALFAELGTIAVFPIAVGLGLNRASRRPSRRSAAPTGRWCCSPRWFWPRICSCPITVVGYLYLGLTYGAYPYLIKWLVPSTSAASAWSSDRGPKITRSQKLTFAVVACTLLCLLFPVAAPLFFSLFLGVAVRESGIDAFTKLLERNLPLRRHLLPRPDAGFLCEANTLLDPTVLKLLLLGMLALTISALGGLLGGYILYFWTGGKFNPIVGIAGVSCVPTTAKIVQKVATAGERPRHHHAAGTGRQHQRRHHLGDHRRDLHRAACG